ncbi:hypothetical protein RQP46_008374 [Phenoliferia psychrophenolica]
MAPKKGSAAVYTKEELGDDPFARGPSKPRPPPARKQNIVKSGNAGSNKPEPVPGEPVAPPPLFPVGYKTPISLLTERCQKEKWDRPSVDPKKSSSGEWTASVTLRRKNAKGVAETVYMRPPPPPSPIAVEKASAMEAKHYAALYALYRFANNLQLKLQLPPQTRDYWAELEKEKASSTPNKQWLWSLTPFETAAAAPPPPPPPTSTSQPSSRIPSATATPSSLSPFGSSATSRAATPTNPKSEAHMSKRWLEAAEIRMPTHLRDLVESTIRGMMTRFPSAVANLADSFSDHLAISDVPAAPTPEDISIAHELTSTGFRKGHVLAALSYVHSARTSTSSNGDALLKSFATGPLRLAVLSYLHLHTPEEDLPAAFRSTKPADAAARIATNKDSDALAESWKADQLALETGFPREIVGTAMTQAEGVHGVAVDLMARKLVGWSGDASGLSEDALLAHLSSGVSEGQDELESRRNDEIEGLEGIFGDRFRRVDTGVEILCSETRRRPGVAQDQVILRVLFHERSSYPSPTSDPTPSTPDPFIHLPTFYVYSSTLPSYIRLHLTALIAQQFASPDHEDWLDLAAQGFGGLVGEMANYLMDVYQRVIDNPPDAREVLANFAPKQEKVVSSVLGKKNANQGGRKGRVSRPPATAQAHAALQRHLEANARKKGYAEMLAIREKLPAWSMKDEIVDLIRNNRVVIVSAIGVASRVGAERLEDINDPNSRFLVGYAIRGERKAGRDCRMLFCTTGVILSRLSRGGDPDLDDISHIFIDEVHERSVDSDFLLLELRDILKRNMQIKMSATINQAQFSDYYGGAPCVEIPGYTHPVQDHYLEEILPNLSGYYPSSKPAKKATQAQLDRMRESFMSRGISNERTLMALEALTRAERIDFNLVGATVAYCLSRSAGSPGGVLVFMPGVMEIKQAVDAIRQAAPSSERIEVFPLHANLSSQEQSSVFRPVKAGHRKVVVATNVAETSITIDGIVYVVDCGRVKENTFDPETGIVKLVETWTSKAASRQQSKLMYDTELFTHYTEETVMNPHPTPEIVRIPLEMLCLQIKAMREDEDVKTFLGKALNPPDVRAIDSAWATLRLLGAIEEEGGTAARLTPLGAHLAMIPVDLRLGKMLVLAAIFRCLDPILTVVALLSSKPFFLNPMEKREESKKARSMFYTSRSDLLSDAKAFEACLAAKSRGNSDLRIFAEDNYISLSTFRDVLNLRNDYLTALSDVGFVPFRASPTAPGLNENASNENLLKAIIFAGTGRLVKVKLPPATFDKGLSGAIERDREAREVKFFEKDGRVFLHPGSLLFTETRFGTPHPLFTYFSKHVTSKPFLRDATEVPLYAVLLFGPKVIVDHERGLQSGADGWVLMRAWPRIGVLVNSLRALFDADLEAQIDEPSWAGETSPVVTAMLALLEKDGSLY